MSECVPKTLACRGLSVGPSKVFEGRYGGVELIGKVSAYQLAKGAVNESMSSPGFEFKRSTLTW